MNRVWYCACGDRLWTREQLLAEADDMANHIAKSYLDERSAYCASEDDVVPREHWRADPIATNPRRPPL